MTDLYSHCNICDKTHPFLSKFLGVCPSCVKQNPDSSIFYANVAHKKARAEWMLPPSVPRGDGVECNICANKCVISEGESGYCGIRTNNSGKIINNAGKRAFLHSYLDPLPTNCCNTYFCPGAQESGFYNLASFFYGCNFSCLGCQNDQHRDIASAEQYSIKKFEQKVIDNPRISCVCFFGGSPEPQLPFAIRAMNKIYKTLEDSRSQLRTCWEWNGAGNEKLVSQAVKLSLNTGGNAKFDLKFRSDILSQVISGVSNHQSFKNFEMCFNKYYSLRTSPVISATTLLIPGYVDVDEVEAIALFLSNLDKSIPYSLLVFHPDSFLSDLPNTPPKQVNDCFEIAKKYLSNVHIGNKHLLW